MERETLTKPIAIIPARSGSQRVKKKNIKLLCGEPVLGHVITTLRMSQLFDQIVVSTDDSEIASVAEKFGAVSPRLRSAELSGDNVSVVEVILDVIHNWGVTDSQDVETCVVYPTAALLTADRLCEGLDSFRGQSLDFLMSVCRFNSPPQRAWVPGGDSGTLIPLDPKFLDVRSQDLQPAFFDAGQMYWSRRMGWEMFRDSGLMRMGFIEFLAEEFVDVDTLEDWIRLEKVFAERMRKEHHGQRGT